MKIAYSERGQFFTQVGFFKIWNIATGKKFPIFGLNFARTLVIPYNQIVAAEEFKPKHPTQSLNSCNPIDIYCYTITRFQNFCIHYRVLFWVPWFAIFINYFFIADKLTKNLVTIQKIYSKVPLLKSKMLATQYHFESYKKNQNGSY